MVGDLFDRATTHPATLEFASSVLESLPAPVLLLPGEHDWYGGNGPYESASMPGNVTVLTSHDVAVYPIGDDAVLAGAAWTAPSRQSLPTGQVEALAEVGPRPCVLVVAGQVAPESLAAGLPKGVHLLTSGQTAGASDATVLRPLVSDGLDAATGAFITVRVGGVVHVEAAELGDCPIRDHGLAVQDLETTAALSAALDSEVSATSEPLRIRLTGTVQAGVLLPGLNGWASSRTDVLVVQDDLSYGPAPQDQEPTTRGEFMRAMAAAALTERERHQATALGLRALQNGG